MDSINNVDPQSIRSGLHSRPETPATESTVPGQGYIDTVLGFLALRKESMQQSWHEPGIGKIKSVLLCLSCPCYTIVRPLMVERSVQNKITHPGVIYFYILLSCTIVFNLWEQQIKDKDESASSYTFLQWFEISCMVLTLFFLVFIHFFTKDSVNFGSHNWRLILYLRIGLYVFGVASLLHTVLNLLNYSNCGNTLQIVFNVIKFVYIAGQILFLNRFYQAKLPGARVFIQIALAHILGTNLSLWIWTLCQRVYVPEPAIKYTNCTSYPIHLNNTEKYFYPLFVEYLLLVASMIYEIWSEVQVVKPRRRSEIYRHHFFAQLENGEDDGNPADFEQQFNPNPRLSGRRDRRRKFAPSVALSLVVGLVFAVIFIAFVLAANDSGKEEKNQFYEFVIVNICVYLSQIIVCYIALVCSHSQEPDIEHQSINLDDALLYFGLAGILLWEGFHFYGLLSIKNSTNPIEFVNSGIGVLEDIIQTTTLIYIRRCRNRNDGNAQSIANCALFLLATNFAFWCQNSFYIEQYLANPGENHEHLEENLEVFAHILNPVIIFFRFHSATCCYHMWSVFHRV